VKLVDNLVNELFGLDGRIALVTGASSGIGRHLAKTLAVAGAKVVLVGRDLRRLGEAAEEIKRAGGNAEFLSADLQKETEMQRVAESAPGHFGAPDIIVNAAGINLREPVDDVTWETWGNTLNINLSAPFFLTRALIPPMRKQGMGNVINIASLQSFRAFPDSMPYGASKGGIAQLTRSMAEAWSQYGIVANAILPGFFSTELTRPIYENPDKLAHNAAMTAIGRNGKMRDLEGTVIFLASRASAYVTGQIIAVDGGFTAK
tara:strand:+ start:3736 stop:4518 length:783 start_codon:yes stop_codon:yes gene_type:complete